MRIFGALTPVGLCDGSVPFDVLGLEYGLQTFGKHRGPSDMVYLFQRPETMERAALKASQELKHGAWMVSLEFEAQGLVPTAVGQASENRPIWLYQQPFQWVNHKNTSA